MGFIYREGEERNKPLEKKEAGGGDRETEKGRERERRLAGPFKREPRECTQEVLLVVADEDIACEDPKGRPVQSPEYRCLGSEFPQQVHKQRIIICPTIVTSFKWLILGLL